MQSRERADWRAEHVEDPLPFTSGKYDPPVVPLERVATYEVTRRESDRNRRASAPGAHPLAPVSSDDEEDVPSSAKRHDSAPGAV